VSESESALNLLLESLSIAAWPLTRMVPKEEEIDMDDAQEFLISKLIMTQHALFLALVDCCLLISLSLRPLRMTVLLVLLTVMSEGSGVLMNNGLRFRIENPQWTWGGSCLISSAPTPFVVTPVKMNQELRSHDQAHTTSQQSKEQRCWCRAEGEDFRDSPNRSS
jgi:hypothetical protein